MDGLLLIKQYDNMKTKTKAVYITINLLLFLIAAFILFVSYGD